MTIKPYVFFDGKCEEALTFYRDALGVEITMMMKFKDSPEPPQMPGIDGEKIMHAAFQINDTLVMASDGECGGRPNFNGFALAYTAKDEAGAQRAFAALGQGGEVAQPLIKTFFAPAFGMVKDRFGMMWMVLCD